MNLLTSAAGILAVSAQKVSRKLFMAGLYSSNLSHLLFISKDIAPMRETKRASEVINFINDYLHLPFSIF